MTFRAWSHRTLARVAQEDIPLVLQWCRHNLGPAGRDSRWSVAITGPGLRDHLLGRGCELAIYTQEPEDHALVQLAWGGDG